MFLVGEQSDMLCIHVYVYIESSPVTAGISGLSWQEGPLLTSSSLFAFLRALSFKIRSHLPQERTES